VHNPAIVISMSVQRTMLLIWALAFFALALSAILYQHTHPLDTQSINASRTVVQVGGETVMTEVADTPALQTRGLSGRASLAEGEGILFVFEEEGEHSIWMKDMHFAIDIIWAAGDGTIVTIKEGATPESYPEVFHSAAPARYVLEVNAGFVKHAGVAVGGKIVVQ